MGNIHSDLFLEQVFSFLSDENIHLEQSFRQLTSWNSLNALIIHHNIEKYFGVSLSNSDFEACTTIQQLYNKVLENVDK